MTTLESLKAEHSILDDIEQDMQHNPGHTSSKDLLITALTAAKLEDEARIAELEAKIVDAEQRATIAEQARRMI